MKIGKSRFIILNTQQDVGGDDHINVMNNLYEVNRQCTRELGQIFEKMISYTSHISTISTSLISEDSQKEALYMSLIRALGNWEE